jgi:hypothetical protein
MRKQGVPIIVEIMQENTSIDLWLILLKAGNPSLTTVPLMLSFVTITGFSIMAGTFILPFTGPRLKGIPVGLPTLAFHRFYGKT